MILTGTSFSFNFESNITFYVSGEGGCTNSGPFTSVEVTASGTPSATEPDFEIIFDCISTGNTGTIAISGGDLGAAVD